MKVETTKEKYIAHRYVSLVVPQHYEEEINDFFKPPASFLSNISDSIWEKELKTGIKKVVANSASITLEVTQNCNLRCKYCPFSGGHYETYRKHNPQRMDYTTYKKAIDFFIGQNINSPFRFNREEIGIFFYGGEPLLEFDNIYRAAKYAGDLLAKNSRKFGLFLMITTNGLLLNLDRAEKLIDKDFKIDISLDGPEEEHNRYRVKPDGFGSFAEVFFNIKKIKEKFPGYFDKNIRFLLTIHPYHDLKKIEEFLLANETLFNKRNLVISRVSTVNLKKNTLKLWYGNNKRLKEQEESLDKEKWFYKKMLSAAFEKAYSTSTRVLYKQNFFTGTCFPASDKLYIDTAGNIHICEKMNPHFVIGDLDSGVDLKTIKRIAENWRRQIVRLECWNCAVWWQCSFCFATCVRFKKFVLNKKKCDDFRKNYQAFLADYLNLKEIEDEANNNDRYNDIDSYLDLL